MRERRATAASLLFGDDVRLDGPFALDLQSRELHTRDGRIAMQAQPFEILRALLERAGRVVEREELRRRLWPEDTFVDYERSLNAAVRRLRVTLGDDAARPKFIETIPRVGYRFLAAAEPGATLGPRRIGAARLRLAVLPVTDVGGAAGFADGLTEELFVQVGRAVGGAAALVARSTCMMFKGVQRRASEVGDALRVDYVFEGTVRMDCDRVRITASLVETSDETHVWTDTAESALEKPLSAQADVATRLAQSLARVFVRHA
jgi:TolB-like protein